MKKLMTSLLALALASSLSLPAVAESARLERVPLPEAAASASTTYARFRDVAATYWGRDGISYVVDKGLFNGTGADTFSPDLTMSRAMLCTVLHRFAGLPAVSGSSGYSDVPDGKWYSDGVAWAKQNNVLPTAALNAAAVKPDDGVTRAEFCVMLRNFYEYMGGNKFNDAMSGVAVIYPDMPLDYTVVAAMSWAYTYSILNGTGEHTMSPDMKITRAQMAAILERYDRQFGTGTPVTKPKEEATPTEPKQEDPTPTTEPTPTTANSTVEQEEEKLIQLINDYRAENGLTKLNKNERLMKIADVRVEEITTKFSHVRPNGKIIGNYGDEYDTGEFSFHENIYKGFFSAERAFNAWKRSPGHNGTMLTLDPVTEIAVGLNTKGYAVMLFG